MEKKGGASCDPGWNDPPLFSYESQVAQIKASKPRTILNKRVAFPLNEASPPSSHVDPTTLLKSCSMSSLPPPPSKSVSKPTLTLPISDDKDLESEETFDSALALVTIMECLNRLLDEKYNVEDKVKCDIQRRLECMRQMWTDDKLCAPVQRKLLSMSQALSGNDLAAADDIQKGLMVDHGAMCSAWMSGVRHLLHHTPPTTE